MDVGDYAETVALATHEEILDVHAHGIDLSDYADVRCADVCSVGGVVEGEVSHDEAMEVFAKGIDPEAYVTLREDRPHATHAEVVQELLSSADRGDLEV
ncbi:hypothetical protein BKA00_002892 [Actinomadura coerulea]|uniref:Uncharacterized protein n=1 Tax=Actinomadura coerulea TaxID=46159 RepID=A0A7X0FY85_9ACTN|nr:hypothetical protein [Actinomadura coerulea]MBB6395978.1 hypothetical protein [Actinomadura coerulea]GGQ30753.1 hypothetical protein GCM10010187_54540 [Actinomadura coerulea]